MGPLHRTESTNDDRYLDEKTVSNHFTSSIMSESSHSEKAGVKNGVVLQITSQQSNQEEEGGNDVVTSTKGIMGRQNGGFVRDQNDPLHEVKGVVNQENDIYQSQKRHHNSPYEKTDNSGSIHGIDSESSSSTPVTQRSRAQSKVSFSDDTKIEIFKRMDSIPAEGESFCEKLTSLRWQTALMCCLVASLSITVRQCMSMAIVCMTDQTTELLTNTSQDNVSLFNTSVEKSSYMIQWDMETQGLVLSSYYYTFPLTPLIGGFLAGKFGGKYVIFMQIFLMCGASISIPFVAYIDPIYVMIARAVVGLTSGGLMPATVQLLSKWAPRLERSRMLSIVNSGQSIGNILTFLLSGFICLIPLQGGWPFIFYIFTSLNLLAILLWAYVVYDSPEVHPRATVKEILYIIQERRSSTSKMPSPPWKKLITSGPFWAILTAHTAHGFIFTVIGTFLPLYMKDVLMYDPTSNGVLSSLPFIGRFIGAFGVGFLADKCMEKKWFSTGTTRKILQCIGMIGSAPFLIALSYMTVERRTLAVVLLICYWTMQSTTNAAFRVNHLDIAPTYAGVVNGITLTCASLAALGSSCHHGSHHYKRNTGGMADCIFHMRRTRGVWCHCFLYTWIGRGARMGQGSKPRHRKGDTPSFYGFTGTSC
ncbi:sialin-like [Pecten maximus]|uniref:sialin-like n=1 Tax=Pecten maximus TaxID=6579 RepID=UPI001457FE24|nr:sialin-like [Pecten maximus]